MKNTQFALIIGIVMRLMLKTLLLIASFTALFTFDSYAQACGEKDYNCQLKAAMKKVEDDPKNIENHFNVGVVFHNSGNCKEAIEAYTMFLIVGVSDPAKMSNAYNSRAVCNKRLKKYTEAFADYAEAIKLTPKDARLYVNRGNAYIESGDGVKAIADFSKAVEVDPKYSPAYAARGHAYFVTGDQVNALSDFNKAIEINPSEAEAYYNRGTLYFQGKKEYARAIPDYDKYISLGTASPGSIADGYMNRGICYLATGNPEKAIDDMNKVIAFDAKWVNAYKVRALAYKDLKKMDLVAADEKKVAELTTK